MYIEFKPGMKHATKGADVSESHEHFQDAGWLIEDDEVIIDIDNLSKEVIEKIIEYFDIKTQTVWTDRGVHFYFRKPEGWKVAKYITPLGFEVESKHSGNTKGITIKRNGELRKIEHEGVRQELPYIFTKMNRKRFESLLGLSDGDGRNSKLHAHRAKMGNVDQHHKILRFINTYIFAEPLDENEFNQVSRDMRFDSKDMNLHQVASEIMREIRTVKYQGAIYWHDGERFVHDDDRLTRKIFKMAGEVETRVVEEIIKQIKGRNELIDLDTQFDIQFRNGILRNGKFIEVKYQGFTPYYIDVDYNPDAKPVEAVDKYISHLTKGDEDYFKLLFEILGHTMIVDPEFKRLLAKFFIFVGDGGNGKGTLLTIIRKILGPENCSGLSVVDMADERYFVTMTGKLANLGDDIQDEPINNKQMKQLKNISTCDYVSVRELYQQSKEVEMTLSLIFTSNHVLKSFEKGESYKRRVMWLPMYTKPTKKDPLFITKLTTDEALEYWLKLIVDGYQRLYTNQKFTQCDLVTDFNNKYHEENNSALIYLDDFKPEHFEDVQPPKMYEEYEIWCEENGMNTQSRKLFNESVCDVFEMEVKVRKIGGKSARVFVKK